MSNESNTTDVNVQFKLNINSGTNRTRSAADLSEIDAAKFVIVAYKQTENGTYSFEKATDSSSNTFDKDNETLSNENFNLPVGTYRFLAIYNVGGNTTLVIIKAQRRIGVIFCHQHRFLEMIKILM